MPNGKTHDKVTLIILPIIIIASIYFLNNIGNFLILVLSYLFSSFMFNGDLDMNSKPYNRWFILKMIWIPYQLLFNHRSIFTHGIIIGTLVRLIYLSMFIIPILYISKNLVLIKTFYNYAGIYKLVLVCIGLELGSAIHTIADKIDKEI
jgi:uncharacterized metal-binding protein